MRISQNRPSVPTQSTSSTELRTTTTAAAAQAPTARGADTFQSGFDAPVRRNTFMELGAKRPLVVTPAPPADGGTASGKVSDDQLRKLLDEAHKLIFGNEANGANVEGWMNIAKKMRDEGKDANTIKYALFDQLRGAPSEAQMKRPDDTLLRKMLDEAHTLIFGNEANGANVEAWMNIAKKMRDEGKDANTIKYALFDQLRQVR